ncbi:hypothetical protein XENOCAPTIV_025562, partial [Xenoophorus captivus]
LLSRHAISSACPRHLCRAGHQYWNSHQILVPLHSGGLCLARCCASHSMQNLLADCLQGCFVVTCTLCAFISLVWLREQIVHGGAPQWLEHNQAPLVPNQPDGPAQANEGPVANAAVNDPAAADGAGAQRPAEHGPNGPARARQQEAGNIGDEAELGDDEGEDDDDDVEEDEEEEEEEGREEDAADANNGAQ